MTILITGVAGFIGFHLARRLLERGWDVVGIDSLNDYYDRRLKVARLAEIGMAPEALAGNPETASARGSGFRFARLSLEDREGMERLFRDHTFDAVCNLAAQAGVRYSLLNPHAYVSSNVTGFLNVLEGCRRQPVTHLVYASSSSVYGTDSPQPFSPQDRADHPLSMYAATKRANELMAYAYGHLYGLSTTGLRFFTVYGPWGRPDMAYYRFTEAIMAGQPIDVYHDGEMFRDFTYIDDAVEGVVRVLDRGPAGQKPCSRLYNIGNSSPVRLSDFIATLESVLGRTAVKRYLPMQPGDALATYADVTDFEREFGWRPATTIRDGLQKFAQWYLSFGAAGGR